MNKKLKIFIPLTIIVIAAVTVLLVFLLKQDPPPSSPPTPPAHTHEFSELTGNETIEFCTGCSAYLVKGTGSEYLDTEEAAQTLEQVLTDENVQPIDGKMNFIISGSVDFDAALSGAAGGAIDLAKNDATEVNIEGLGQNPELTLVTGDTDTADTAVFRTKFHNNKYTTPAAGKISITGLKINDTRKTSTSHYTLTNTEFVCGELYLNNCTFTNCIQFNRGTKAIIENCEFDFNTASRYSIWAGYVGGDGGTNMDHVETFIIKGCTFKNTTRGIKVVTSGANITIEGNTFIGLTEKPAIVLDSLNVELNTVLLKNNTFTDCTKGDWNSPTNNSYDEPYSEQYFNVTVE